MNFDGGDSAQSDKLIQQAKMLYELDRPLEALPLLAKALSLTPENARAYGWMSGCYLALNDNQKALQYAEATTKADPQNEWGYRLQSVVLRRLGKEKKALIVARQAVKAEPEGEFPLLEFCNALSANRKYQAAMETAQKLRALYSEKSDVHLQLGYICMELNKFQEAEKHLREAIRIDPNSYNALNNLGLTLIEQSVRKFWKVKDARELSDKGFAFLESAVKLSPNKELARANIHQSVRRIEIKQPVNILGFGLFLICLFWARFTSNPFAIGCVIIIIAIMSGFEYWRKKQYSQFTRKIYEYENKRTNPYLIGMIRNWGGNDFVSEVLCLGAVVGLGFLIVLLFSSTYLFLKIVLSIIFVINCFLVSKTVRQKL